MNHEYYGVFISQVFSKTSLKNEKKKIFSISKLQKGLMSTLFLLERSVEKPIAIEANWNCNLWEQKNHTHKKSYQMSKCFSFLQCGPGREDKVSETYSVFHRFRQAKFDYDGSILSLSQFLILPQLPQKVGLTSKVVKVDSKIIFSLLEI